MSEIEIIRILLNELNNLKHMQSNLQVASELIYDILSRIRREEVGIGIGIGKRSNNTKLLKNFEDHDYYLLLNII